jgi:glutathione S-transferase
VTKEDIDGAVEKFTKWLKMLETRLASLDGVYFGGNSINIGDFSLFALFSSTVRNKAVNSVELQEALAATLVEAPHVVKWLDAMSTELRDYLEQREPRPL